jgi:hypothetical protein
VFPIPDDESPNPSTLEVGMSTRFSNPSGAHRCGSALLLIALCVPGLSLGAGDPAGVPGLPLPQDTTDLDALKLANHRQWQQELETAAVVVRPAPVGMMQAPGSAPEEEERARLKAQATLDWERNRPERAGREVPVNDACGSATAITDGTWPFSTVEALRELPPALCDGWSSDQAPDVWFRYLATCSGTVEFSLCDANYDSNITVWDDCGGTVIGCNEDVCGLAFLNPVLSLPVVAGQEFLLQVSGYGGQYGSGNLVAAATCAAPLNDLCGAAIPVTGGAWPYATLDGGREMAPLLCGPYSSQNAPDVWFRYDATCSGSLELSVCNSTFDTNLTLWDGCGGTVLACNEDACGSLGFQSRLAYSVSEGSSYLIQVSGYYNQFGWGTLEVVDPCMAPANDSCADALGISGQGSYYCDTRMAGVDGGPCAPYGPDVWFLYTADCAGPVRFTTCGGGSTFDPALSLYDACGGSPLACNNDYQTFDGFPCGDDALIDTWLVEGQQVWVQVGSWYTLGGQTTLTVTRECSDPVNDLCHLALPVSEGVTPFSTVNAETDGPYDYFPCISEYGNAVLEADVWFDYQPGQDGVVTASLLGSGFDTNLAVYEGDCPYSLDARAIACNDNYGSLQSQVDFPVCAGRTYRIRVGGAHGQTGTGLLSLALVPGVTPLSPANLEIILQGEDVLLVWDPVLLSQAGCPLDFVLYEVRVTDEHGNSWVAGSTTGTDLLLPGANAAPAVRRYQVRALGPAPAAAASGPGATPRP